jgi:cell division protein ZipA
MSALQWALLILSVAIVVAVVVISRREREPAEPRREKPRKQQDAPPRPAAAEPVREQLDIFDEPEARPAPASTTAPLFPEPVEPPEEEIEPPPLLRPSLRDVPRRPDAPPPRVEPVEAAGPAGAAPASAGLPPMDPMINPLSGKQYDEFGVGRPRRRSMPTLDAAPANDSRAAEPAAAPPAAPPTKVPAWVRAAPSAAPNTPATAAPPKVEQKIVALMIVEREGGMISGSKLHSALSAQGLVFGAKQIYHRLARDESVFAVASLTKPGVLLPNEAAQFSTPGLSTFMVLPGPVKPLNALHDMLATTQALARALNAEVYDSKKQPLTSETMRALQADVEAWARAAQL